MIMFKSSLKYRADSPAGKGLQLFSTVSLVLSAGWLLVASLGCIGVWTDINTFSIDFEPAFFRIEGPGQQGTVQAQLLWDGRTGRLEAQTWTIEGPAPTILSSASVSPGSGSTYTNINLICSGDASRFREEDLWVASLSSQYRLCVKARFFDPVWKSVSEGQEVLIARTAYLSLRSGLPRMSVKLVSISAADVATFSVKVENPLEGWRYFADVKSIFQLRDGSMSTGSNPRQEIGPGGGSVYESVPARYLARRGCVRFVLTVHNGSGPFSESHVNIPIVPTS